MLSFEELYTTQAADVHRFVLWLSGDTFVAADITSETFVRAWGRRAVIRTETLRAYLFMIARNIYLEQRRYQEAHLPLSDVHIDPKPDPAQQAAAKAKLRRVREFLKTVPEVDRAAFILRVQQELPYAEIARVLGLSLSAAKVKVHRVRKRLLLHFVEEQES